MYPYRTRWRWLLFGRYSHLVHAVTADRQGRQDTVLDHRLAGLRRWNLVRFLVSIPLSAGVLATVGSALIRVLPETQADAAAEDALLMFQAVATGATGVLTALYLLLTRLLGQLEIDVLTILTRNET